MRGLQAVVIVVLSLAGGAMVAAATFTRSYIPLFVAWVAFGAIPWALGLMEGDGQR